MTGNRQTLLVLGFGAAALAGLIALRGQGARNKAAEPLPAPGAVLTAEQVEDAFPAREWSRGLGPPDPPHHYFSRTGPSAVDLVRLAPCDGGFRVISILRAYTGPYTALRTRGASPRRTATG